MGLADVIRLMWRKKTPHGYVTVRHLTTGFTFPCQKGDVPDADNADAASFYGQAIPRRPRRKTARQPQWMMPERCTGGNHSLLL